MGVGEGLLADEGLLLGGDAEAGDGEGVWVVYEVCRMALWETRSVSWVAFCISGLRADVRF